MPRGHGGGRSDTPTSPVIWRCTGCGALVHVADVDSQLAWCPRCSRIVEALRDGGGDGH